MHEGRFINGLKDGFGRSIYKHGDYYEGNWKNGLKHGFGI